MPKLMDNGEMGRLIKDKIVCLVGASGSGKTTIAKKLERKFNIIHSYTTRRPRREDEWGHIFINVVDYVDDIFSGVHQDESNVIKIHDDEMIAYKRIYKEHYFATREQYQGKGTSIYIVDPDGAKEVQENVKDAEVVTIFLMADKDVREDRLFVRDNDKSLDVLERMSKAFYRLEKDKEIFKTCKCDYVVDANRGLEEVVKDVIEIIGDGNVD